MKRGMKITVMSVTIMMFGVSVVRAESIVFTESGQILEGEMWDFVEIYNDDTVVDMSGGFADYITTHDWSTLNVTGGSAEFGAIDYSTINISGGSHSAAIAYEGAMINIYDDAYLQGLGTNDFATTNVTGGIIEGVSLIESGTLNIYGGVISDYLAAYDSSTVNIFGYDLYKSSSGGAYGDGQVWGFFSDDTAFSFDLIEPDTYSHINLVPEPYTVSLFGLGALLLRKKM